MKTGDYDGRAGIGTGETHGSTGVGGMGPAGMGDKGIGIVGIEARSRPPSPAPPHHGGGRSGAVSQPDAEAVDVRGAAERGARCGAL